MLSDEDVDKFLDIMLPLLFKSLYSKSGRVGKAFLSQHVAERVANEAFRSALQPLFEDTGSDQARGGVPRTP